MGVGKEIVEDDDELVGRCSFCAPQMLSWIFFTVGIKDLVQAKDKAKKKEG